MKLSTTDLAKLIWKTSLPDGLQWEVISEYMIRSVCDSCRLPHNKRRFMWDGGRRSGRTTKAIIEAIVTLIESGGVDFYVSNKQIAEHVVYMAIQLLEEMGVFIQMASKHKIMTQYGIFNAVASNDRPAHRSSARRVCDHSYGENREFFII